MKNLCHVKRRNAFTLVELAIAMVLMTFVLFLAGSLMNMGSISFTGSELYQSLVREDSAFAAKLNNAIQESTVSFTVPKNSFNDTSKLTAGWNYLGLMDNVHIPKGASRTGKEIDSAQALVYIEYAGESAPSSIPSDCNLIHNSEGYFIQKILSHAFTDHLGTTHSYTLEFKPTNPNNTAAQTIIYEFKSDVSNSNGEVMGTHLDIGPMLSCLNAIQVVYKGGSTNPATALAFRSDFMPTWSAQQASTTKPSATVVMVLDTSGSMKENFSGTTRANALKDNAIKLVEDLSKNENINVIIMPFSQWAGAFNCQPAKFFYNLGTEKQECINRINGLNFNYVTNVGDGIRGGYVELQNAYSRGVDVGSVFLMIMTDGAMNYYSLNSSGSGFYMGSNIGNHTWYNGYTASGDGNNKNATHMRNAREYARIWGKKWTSEINISKSFLLSLADGMSDADKQVLSEVFGEEPIDINNLTDFQTIFEDIGTSIEEYMWAFEGPKL